MEGVILVIFLNKLGVIIDMYMEFYEKVEGLVRVIGVIILIVKKYYLFFEEYGYNFKCN